MSDSIGARLRQARELRRLTLQQVSDTTKVRTHYLQALENDDQSAIPSAAQARGFLRIYAAFLELDLAELVPPVPPPAVTSLPEASAPVASAVPVPDSALAPAVRPSLWTSLRERFSRRTPKVEGVASLPTDLPSAATQQQPVESTASSDTQPTRRSKPASVGVKKNVGR
jgi:transcriptional regulator with XRE-family HTH domain